MKKLCIVIIILVLVILLIPSTINKKFNEKFENQPTQLNKNDSNLIFDFLKKSSNKYIEKLINDILMVYGNSQGICLINNQWTKCDDDILIERGLKSNDCDQMEKLRLNYFVELSKKYLFNKPYENIITELIQLYTQIKKNDLQQSYNLSRREIIKLFLIYHISLSDIKFNSKFEEQQNYIPKIKLINNDFENLIQQINYFEL